jgi:hypothetical protein
MGRLTGFQRPRSECADANGDVWIADFAGYQMVEYAHGGHATHRGAEHSERASRVLDRSNDRPPELRCSILNDALRLPPSSFVEVKRVRIQTNKTQASIQQYRR